MTSSWRHEPTYVTHYGVVINRAKFDACTCSSFRGVKIDRHTDRIALYKNILDAFALFTIFCQDVERYKKNFTSKVHLFSQLRIYGIFVYKGFFPRFEL